LKKLAEANKQTIAGVAAQFEEERKYYIGREKKLESELAAKELGLETLLFYYYILFTCITNTTCYFRQEKERITGQARISYDRGYIQGKEEEKLESKTLLENLKLEHLKQLQDLERSKNDFEQIKNEEVERLKLEIMKLKNQLEEERLQSEEDKKREVLKVVEEKLKVEEKMEREKVKNSKVRSVIVAAAEKQIKGGFSIVPKVFDQKVLWVSAVEKKGICNIYYLFVLFIIYIFFLAASDSGEPILYERNKIISSLEELSNAQISYNVHRLHSEISRKEKKEEKKVDGGEEAEEKERIKEAPFDDSVLSTIKPYVVKKGKSLTGTAATVGTSVPSTSPSLSSSQVVKISSTLEADSSVFDSSITNIHFTPSISSSNASSDLFGTEGGSTPLSSIPPVESQPTPTDSSDGLFGKQSLFSGDSSAVQSPSSSLPSSPGGTAPKTKIVKRIVKKKVEKSKTKSLFDDDIDTAPKSFSSKISHSESGGLFGDDVDSGFGGLPDTTEIKPIESQPTETQLTESQPIETQPTESQLTESQPIETQPTESQLTETQPTEPQPIETQPFETQLIEPQTPKQDTSVSTSLFNETPDSTVVTEIFPETITGPVVSETGSDNQELETSLTQSFLTTSGESSYQPTEVLPSVLSESSSTPEIPSKTDDVEETEHKPKKVVSSTKSKKDLKPLFDDVNDDSNPPPEINIEQKLGPIDRSNVPTVSMDEEDDDFFTKKKTSKPSSIPVVPKKTSSLFGDDDDD
jgi:hypothetical protein